MKLPRLSIKKIVLYISYLSVVVACLIMVKYFSLPSFTRNFGGTKSFFRFSNKQGKNIIYINDKVELFVDDFHLEDLGTATLKTQKAQKNANNTNIHQYYDRHTPAAAPITPIFTSAHTSMQHTDVSETVILARRLREMSRSMWRSFWRTGTVGPDLRCLFTIPSPS